MGRAPTTLKSEGGGGLLLRAAHRAALAVPIHVADPTSHPPSHTDTASQAPSSQEGYSGAWARPPSLRSTAALRLGARACQAAGRAQAVSLGSGGSGSNSSGSSSGSKKEEPWRTT
jgi:hypothetical protein